MTKSESLQQQYKRALQKLDEVLREQKSEIMRDFAMKRFEIVLDLAWKLLKDFLEEKKGVVCNSPKDCFRAAYKSGIIEYDDLWLQMTDWRNEAVHTYSEEFADDLYEKLPRTFEKFKYLEEQIK